MMYNNILHTINNTTATTNITKEVTTMNKPISTNTLLPGYYFRGGEQSEIIPAGGFHC